jgi:hypothetical protein
VPPLNQENTRNRKDVRIEGEAACTPFEQAKLEVWLKACWLLWIVHRHDVESGLIEVGYRSPREYITQTRETPSGL